MSYNPEILLKVGKKGKINKMSTINYQRTGEYLKLSLKILEEKGGEFPSADLVSEMEKRLEFNNHEKSLNNTGSPRWLTRFRFYTIGLVKAGWIEKTHGIWKITEKAKDFDNMSSIDIYNYSVNSYDEWNKNRIGSDESIELSEEDEPLILMQVKPDDIDFVNLINGIDSGKIQIPPFQRSFVWKPSDIRYLLDSIYRGFPVGSYIFWRTTRKLPRTRTIGNIRIQADSFSEGTEISYVIDGQQRITSLYAAVKGSTIDDENYRFLFDLRKKRFIVSKTESLENSLFTENDTEKLVIPIGVIFTESRASYMQFIRQYPDEFQDTLNNLYDRFVSYRFSVIQVVDQLGTNEEEKSEGVRQVVRMFSRINETGKKLTVVAKMVARCWGEGFDLREALDDFFARDERLIIIREETFLQACSVILNFRKSHSRDILDTNIQKLESEWDNITEAFLLAVQFVTTKLHIQKLHYLPFDATLVPLTYFFYKKKEPDHRQTQLIEQWFWRVCLSNRYDATVASKLEEDCSEFDRLLDGKEPKFMYLIDWETLKERLISQRYNLRNAFVKTVFSLYSYLKPQNLTDGRDVALDKVFTGYYKHNFHHIFPLKYLRENEAENQEFFDSIVNIMFIPSITNIEISGTPPSEYISNFQKQNPDLKNIMSRHFIYDLDNSRLSKNNFMGFLEYRAEQIFNGFRVRTGVASSSEELLDTEPTKPIDILESQIRRFIHEKLRDKVEEAYWEEYIPADIQNAVDQKIQSELKRHPYKIDEFLRDGVRITYLDIMDYSKIIISNWQIFGEFFGSKGETDEHFRALKYFRNPVKHTRGVNEVDKKRGEAAVMWLENILRV